MASEGNGRWTSRPFARPSPLPVAHGREAGLPTGTLTNGDKRDHMIAPSLANGGFAQP